MNHSMLRLIKIHIAFFQYSYAYNSETKRNATSTRNGSTRHDSISNSLKRLSTIDFHQFYTNVYISYENF